MVKKEQEFFIPEDIPWTLCNPIIPGVWERILNVEEGTDAVTRLLRYEPGASTEAAGVMQHKYWEEVYIIEGYMHDLRLDQKFYAGSVACRPPGMKHGPWVCPEGCLTYEVRYYK